MRTKTSATGHEGRRRGRSNVGSDNEWRQAVNTGAERSERGASEDERGRVKTSEDERGASEDERGRARTSEDDD